MFFVLALLSLVGANHASYTWDNSILEIKPWKVDKCDVLPEEDVNCMIDSQRPEKCFLSCIDPKQICTINIALILPSSDFYLVSLNKSKEMLEDAVKEARSLELIHENIKIEITHLDDSCRAEYAAIKVIKNTLDACAHAIFGLVCEYCLANARTAKYIGNYGIPVITPGGFAFDFTNEKTRCSNEFYMVINSGSVDFRSFSEFMHLIMHRYKWKKVALMYNRDAQSEVGGERTCKLLMSTIAQELSSIDNFQYDDGDLQLLKMNISEYLTKNVGVQYGIILTCMTHLELRELAIEAHRLNMAQSGEYTIFNFQTYNKASIAAEPWFDPSDTPDRNDMAQKGYRSIFTILPAKESNFTELETSGRPRGSSYLDGLYEGMLLYATAINSSMEDANTTYPFNLTGFSITSKMMGLKFKGKNGEPNLMNCNGQRVAQYVMLNLNSSGTYDVVAQYTNLNKTIVSWEVIWVNGDPLDTPVCGYDMSLCPTYNPVSALLISLIAVLILGALIVGFILYRHLRLKAAIYSMAWKVNFDDILFLPMNTRSSFQSTASLRKGSQITLFDVDGFSIAGDRQLYTTVGYFRSIKVAVKYLQEVKIELNDDHLKELKNMKDLSNENLVKFYGACVDIPNCILTEYCPKGSLQDILENDHVQLDSTFKMSLLMDVVRGMTYLHSSVIKSHGALKSTNCLIDSRFVLRIADFGIHFLRKYSVEIENDIESHAFWERQLWTAPELLRMHNPPAGGSPKGDIYSFAIIMHEIIEREGVFYIEGDTKTAREKVDAVRKGADANGGQILRPSLGEALCEEEVAQIMKKCWAEDPADRPDFANLKHKLRNINKESDGNLLDNLLARMEQYANNLESLVEERTADYLEEKRKCEELLYQLLPKSVAQQLITGEAVIAETFEYVTIHFSDIVGFTALSADSTPLQVVEFLNDLYTCFDSIIENFDVYKVETIGDSYMVVSGLPVRNGNRHAREIARMSLALLKAVKTFKIRHRCEERLQLRIGIHTGPCVAGVVGLKMPRYCLFGDTVNTASRMETNGLPLRIHISHFTKEFLDMFGTFDVECRGEVELKGKGKMVTYWLNGESASENNGGRVAEQKVGTPATRLPVTPIASTVRKQMASNGKLLNEITQDHHQREDADVPLLSITSPL